LLCPSCAAEAPSSPPLFDPFGCPLAPFSPIGPDWRPRERLGLARETRPLAVGRAKQWAGCAQARRSPSGAGPDARRFRRWRGIIASGDLGRRERAPGWKYSGPFSMAAPGGPGRQPFGPTSGSPAGRNCAKRNWWRIQCVAWGGANNCRPAQCTIVVAPPPPQSPHVRSHHLRFIGSNLACLPAALVNSLLAIIVSTMRRP